MICKLDMEKANDHVSWSSLIFLLHRMSFGYKLCSWIKSCISFISFALMVNGSLSNLLKHPDALDREIYSLVSSSLLKWRP